MLHIDYIYIYSFTRACYIRLIIFVHKSMLHIDCIYSFTRACYIYIVYIRSQEHVTYILYIFVHKSMLHIYCIYSFTRACYI